jgi:hypothetical protein
MSALFTAKSADGRAQWRILYDHVEQNMVPGDTISFNDLVMLLEVEDRKRVYQIVALTNRELWAKAQRSLSVVRHIGYRVLKADEHELQALGQQKQARKRMTNAVAIMQATDLRALAPDKRNWTLRVTAGLVAVGRAIDAHAEQLAQHDGMIRDLAARIEKLEDEDKDGEKK